MKHKSVALGFSGGMDSITAARRLLSDGYDVKAVTLDMLGEQSMVDSAASAAQEVGVEHYVRYVGEDFRSLIIDYFAQSYMAGCTPAPCTLCNPLIKWRHLALIADELSVEAIATGHYFRVEQYNNRYYVARAADNTKDQSYYLWGLSQSLLSRVLTPMGDVLKADVKRNFVGKGESMGLCFLQGQSYRDFLMQHYPMALRKGDIVNMSGVVVGKHDGISFYTIGQKRGLDIVGEQRCIVAIDAASNRLIVGDNADLYHATLEIKQCNIIDIDEVLSANDITVIIRGIGRNPQGYARRVEPIEGGFRIQLDDPAWAAAKGQPVVLYRQNRVIGGGILNNSY